MLNNCNLMGRMVKDPELRVTNSGKSVTSFTIAVDRDFKQNDDKITDFIDCVAWGTTADFVSKYFAKGDLIAVGGRLQFRAWEDRDGNKRRNAEIVSDHVYFAGSKRDKNNNTANVSEPSIDGFMPVNDDDLPF